MEIKDFKSFLPVKRILVFYTPCGWKTYEEIKQIEYDCYNNIGIHGENSNAYSFWSNIVKDIEKLYPINDVIGDIYINPRFKRTNERSDSND